jgi:hypothetical protein
MTNEGTEMYNTIKTIKENIEIVRTRLSDPEMIEALNKINEGVEIVEWHVA